MRFRITTFQTACPVQRADFFFETLDNFRRRSLISVQVQMFDLTADNPMGHGIDIKADHVTAEAVCLN
ncbi:MAG: hypothetical protein ACD_75C00661G0001 [uncultured bacterium]|nr:MAG: hypothetical protein ACD_75C00661G0001 [uncultured bacterium]